ncbi:MAG: 3-phosphoshikimate 1-carboxyvinyltransferase [Ruminococcus sp.]|jgi:3-phosphoshikimate 1-carboxyvinyltransferase|nr:3-phosphoshikimate 1-carboxyvinyltransferase [Ruminococcus sp.]
MTVTIKPSALRGSITPPPSKSFAHRALIAAALSHGVSKIENIELSEDIIATINCLKSIGADIKIDVNINTAVVKGIEKIPQKAILDCHESGSTLRFMIPVCAALGITATFIGSGKLPSRPIDTYKRELAGHGINFSFKSDLSLPLEISGKLQSGIFNIEGDISSQYITGLLFALPLSGGGIKTTSPLQSKGYVDITIDVLKNFGVNVSEKDGVYTANGTYNPTEYYVERDFSQAAFWYATENVDVENMNENSIQTDKKCIEILSRIKSETISEIDVSQIPDLLPILAVTAASHNKKIIFTNAKRLVIKESNRLKSTAEMINALGRNAEYNNDSLTVFGLGKLRGGKVEGYNDHRIVMSAAIAAENCESDVIITDAGAVNKSYPSFWDEYRKLSGKIIEN